MRKVLIALFLMVLFAPVFGLGPEKYTSYQVEVGIREDGTVNETIALTFPTNATSFDFYLLHPAYVQFSEGLGDSGKCTSSLEGTGTIVTCQNVSISRISMQFDYEKLVRTNSTLSVLSDQYIFLTPTDEFTLRVALPKGYVVSESGVGGPSTLPYYPPSAVQGTNGQQIYLEWKLDQPKVGSVFSYSVAYEKAINPESNRDLLTFIGVMVVVIGALLMLIYTRKKPTLKEYGLNEDERKVLDVLLKENKVSQKKISRETGFSKAHVSRLAKNLEERGIIERKRRGRTYEVMLND